MDSAMATKERLCRAFNNLEKESDALSRFVIQWKELNELFAEAEKNVQQRYDELSAREEAFDTKSKKLQDALNERELAIQRKEQELADRIQPKPLLPVQNIKVERMDSEAVVVQPVNESKKQEQEDGGMDLDLNIPHPSSSEAHEDSPGHQDDDSVGELIRISLKGEGTQEEAEGGGGGNINNNNNMNTIQVEVSVRPELKTLCENMDGEGLRRFIVEHRKEVGVLRHEIPCALRNAAEPARMVVTALEAYHPEPCGNQRKETEGSATRRACILLLECLQVVLADPVLGVNHPVVPSTIKEVAKELAEKWSSRMDTQRDAAGSFLDAQAFLQLLATFGIASEHDEDELCKLISAIARRKQTPALCRALGLSAKIPDIVDRLVQEGKQIEALSFAKEFGIMDSIQPVLLLKNYLKEARKTAQSMLKSGHSSAAAQNDATMKELSALRSVLKCIEEYNLEAEYPSSPLQKRIVLLEKAKLDRKRTGGSVKGQSKRPRGNNNGYNSYRNSDRNSDRAPQYVGGASLPAYQYVPSVTFESQVGYIPSYPPATRNTVSLPPFPSTSYLYPATDGTLYGAAGYTPTPATSYASYPTIRTLPPPPPAYQATYM